MKEFVGALYVTHRVATIVAVYTKVHAVAASGARINVRQRISLFLKAYGAPA